jgi:hypothetical protein
VRDDDIRASCFAALDVLCAKHGPELPYAGGLDAGFAFRGRRVPFLNYQKGIYRAAVQRGPAALSVNTSFKSPYDDAETPDGFLYAYRAGDIDPTTERSAPRSRPGRRSSTSSARGRGCTGPSGRSSSPGTTRCHAWSR